MKSVPFAGCHQKILRAGGNMKSIQHFPYTSEKYICNCSTLFLPVLNLNGTIKLRFLCPGPATALALDKLSDYDQKLIENPSRNATEPLKDRPGRRRRLRGKTFVKISLDKARNHQIITKNGRAKEFQVKSQIYCKLS